MESLWEWLSNSWLGEFFKSNDLAAGGLAAAGGAVALNYVLQNVSSVYNFCKKQLIRAFFIDIKLDQHDFGFQWVASWIKDQIEAEDKRVHTYEVAYKYDSEGESSIYLRQGAGHWWLRPLKCLIFARVHRREESTNNGTKVYSSMTLTTFRWNVAKMNKIFEDIVRKYSASKERKIYKIDSECGSFDEVGDVPRAKLANVHLPEGMKEDILGDLQSFMESRDRYEERGIPYSRGYLLYGKPGNGKTSLIRALANELNKSILILRPADLASGKVQNLITRTGGDTLIVVEDIDRDDVVNKTNKSSTGADLSVFSESLRGGQLQSILQLFDGLQGGNGQIIILTANNPEKLDDAFMRPGRIDRKIELPNANKEQMSSMFKRFYMDMPNIDDYVEDFSSKVDEGAVSMAQLQGHFLKNPNPADAVKNVQDMFEEENVICS